MSAQPAGASSAPTPAFILSNLLICSLLWGSAFFFVKLSGNLNPFVLASMRGVIGATSLAAWFLFQGKSILPQRHELPVWAFLGTFNGWLPNVLVAYALTQLATAPDGAVQTRPHAPQFCASVATSTQVLPQLTRGLLQTKLQSPPTHTPLPPSGALHVAPQPPQFLASLLVSTQRFPHVVVPPPQLAAQAPAEQTSPAAHFFPHAPQFSGSRAITVQASPHT